MHLKSWAPLLLSGALFAGGCAGGKQPAAPSPENLTALEAQLQQNPGDATLITRVGIANYEAKKYERARDVLRTALVAGRQNHAARVYLGLSFEELGQLDSARAAFTTAAARAKNARQRTEIENHLELLTRKELQAAAKDAVAREATLASQPPTENSVAVFPFRYVGSNPELQPVGRGLTQLMITDLSKVSRLRLLERERVQALVDEMALTDAGRVDPASGARSGRMLRAARVLQGSVQDVPGRTDLKLDATVVDARNSGVVATGTATDQLAQLFALQKAVLLRLVEQMGIALSPAERRALSERQTADLQAFLAFSRGLEAEDRGDWRTAEREYTTAVARDPSFKAAQNRQQTAQQITSAQSTTPTQMAGGPGGETGPSQDADRDDKGTVLRSGVLNTVPSATGVVVSRLGDPIGRIPMGRPPLPETFGFDNAGNPGGLQGVIVIIITRP